MPDWFFDEHTRYSLSENGERQFPKRDAIIQLEMLVQSNPKEIALQRFLEANPSLFYSFMRTGHGNWVFPQLPLGKDFVPDFLYCAGNSGGPTWTLVELESPRQKPFLKDGNFSESLRTALNQVRDWRRYISDNHYILRKPKSEGGQGLFLLRPRSFARIIIGRRPDKYPTRYQRLRQEIREDENIEVISYDTFVEEIKDRWREYYVKVFGQQPID